MKQSGRAHEACCNGRHLYIGEVEVALQEDSDNQNE